MQMNDVVAMRQQMLNDSSRIWRIVDPVFRRSAKTSEIQNITRDATPAKKFDEGREMRLYSTVWRRIWPQLKNLHSLAGPTSSRQLIEQGIID